MENKKRCPKCGEENPPEAVMCWACYTPLSSAGAGGSAAPSKNPAKAPQITDDDDDEYRKPGVPPWQIAVIVIGLLFGLYTVGKNFLPAKGSDDNLPAAKTPAATPAPSGTPAPASASPGTSSPSTGTVTAVTPQKLPFTIAVSPNPNITVGTMAIVPTDSNISTGQAASLASFTMSQFSQMKRWKKLYIFVFQDQQAAKQFSDYQRPRHGDPLGDADYRNLTNLWGSALSCYAYDNGNYHVYTPTDAPSSWWIK